MNTPSDHLGPLAGYYPSHWPCECAGPRRQKITWKAGPNIRPGEALHATTRHMGAYRWSTMIVLRDEGEVYVQGGTQAAQKERSFGWIEKVDPVTLETIKAAPELPSGGHNWCGAAAVHANGDLYVVNGRYAHRLSPDLDVLGEHKLATDNAHNGHVIVPDGNLITKDIQIDPSKRTMFTVLDPDLKVVSEFEFPGNSVGRFSCDPQDGLTHLYVTNSEKIHRLIYRGGFLSLDETWSASYRIDGEDQSFAWDSTLALGSAWFMDMGANGGVKNVLEAHPVGTNTAHTRANVIHTAPQRVFRVSVTDPTDRDTLVPFGDAGGNIIAPPLFDQDRRILVAFDSMNAKMGAWRYQGPGQFEELWTNSFRNTNQLTLYADTGELLVDDSPHGAPWYAVVLDIETGQEKARADTGCSASSGMWYTPGFERDFYTSTLLGGVARLYVE